MGYSEQTKQAAYELYRGDQHRPLDQLADKLATLPDGAPVPVDTIRDWRHRYHWDARVQEEIASLSPVLINAAARRYKRSDDLLWVRAQLNF